MHEGSEAPCCQLTSEMYGGTFLLQVKGEPMGVTRGLMVGLMAAIAACWAAPANAQALSLPPPWAESPEAVVPTYPRLKADAQEIRSALSMYPGPGDRIDQSLIDRIENRWTTLASGGNALACFYKFQTQWDDLQQWMECVTQAGLKLEALMPEAEIGLRFSIAGQPAEAVKWLKRAASNGDARALMTLSIHYFDGDGVAKDPAEGTRLLRQAGEAGETYALEILAERYRKGEGVPRNPAEAARLLRQAASAGNTSAAIDLADMLSTGEGVAKNPTEAVQLYLKVADAWASDESRETGWLYFKIAQAYTTGVGAPKDDAKAVYYLNLAIEGDSADAVAELAERYLAGRGVEKSPSHAARILRDWVSQSDRGDWSPRPQDSGWKVGFLLGQLYMNGEGVVVNYEEAYKWLALANMDKALALRETLERKMSPEQIGRAQRAAQTWIDDNRSRRQ